MPRSWPTPRWGVGGGPLSTSWASNRPPSPIDAAWARCCAPPRTSASPPPSTSGGWRGPRWRRSGSSARRPSTRIAGPSSCVPSTAPVVGATPSARTSAPAAPSPTAWGSSPATGCVRRKRRCSASAAAPRACGRGVTSAARASWRKRCGTPPPARSWPSSVRRGPGRPPSSRRSPPGFAAPR